MHVVVTCMLALSPRMNKELNGRHFPALQKATEGKVDQHPNKHAEFPVLEVYIQLRDSLSNCTYLKILSNKPKTPCWCMFWSLPHLGGLFEIIYCAVYLDFHELYELWYILFTFLCYCLFYRTKGAVWPVTTSNCNIYLRSFIMQFLHQIATFICATSYALYLCYFIWTLFVLLHMNFICAPSYAVFARTVKINLAWHTQIPIFWV